MSTFVPLGIPAYDGSIEKGKIKFIIEIQHNNADKMEINVREGGNTLYKETITDPGRLTQGEHDWYWDGFDINGILDTALLTKGSLNLWIQTWYQGDIENEFFDFNASYDEVEWVDVKINKNTKRIDVTLRVNLKDGGAEGLDNWNDIPKKDLIVGKPPLQTQTRSFKDLEQLAVQGINYHWGRNSNHAVAKQVIITGTTYEVFINAVNTKENAMDDVSLVFNTNNKWMRSGNPGTVEDFVSFVGNIVSREAVCYNVGYIKYSNGWAYQNSIDEDLGFMDTAAHEIGHTILKAFGGTTYSYGHKGSVNTVTQNKKSSAPKFPLKGEIDIMPYYNDNIYGNEYYQKNYYKRRVASESDVSSLIWLTKIELK